MRPRTESGPAANPESRTHEPRQEQVISLQMVRILDRYVIREVIPPFLLSLLIFTFILAIPPVMQQLEALVAKGVAWQTAGRILVLLIPQSLGLTIPWR